MSTTSTSTPERSLNRQIVLEEDEYTEALSHIIARDFFPSLVHLDATNSYLDALQSQDPRILDLSVRRLQEISATPSASRSALVTPAQTPLGRAAVETPVRTSRSRGELLNKRIKLDDNLCLDAFQARYTSEDNSSFTQILDEENRKRKEKWAWAWDAQKRVEAQQAKALEGRQMMMIEGAPAPGVRERLVIEAPQPAGLLTEAGENQETQQDTRHHVDANSSLVISKLRDEESPVDVMAPKKDTRAAGVDGWKFKTRNAFMFPPDADVSPYHPPISIGGSKDDLRTTKYANTRFSSQQSDTSATVHVPPSPTRSRIEAAIAGTPYRPSSPTMNSNLLVPAVPSPTSSELGPLAVKQLMTTGTLSATPRIISQPDEDVPTPSTPFHIPALSSREIIGQRLSSSASKNLRAKAELLNLVAGKSLAIGLATPSRQGRGSMAPPSWTPRRADAPGNLTPAAKRLLDRTTMTTAAARRAEAMNRMATWDGKTVSANGKDLSAVKWTPTSTPVRRD